MYQYNYINQQCTSLAYADKTVYLGVTKMCWVISYKQHKIVNQNPVVTTNSPVEPSATGIKIKSSDQEVNL